MLAKTIFKELAYNYVLFDMRWCSEEKVGPEHHEGLRPRMLFSCLLTESLFHFGLMVRLPEPLAGSLSLSLSYFFFGRFLFSLP